MAKTTVRCIENTCFQNDGCGHCKLLTSPIKNHRCPFYKTYDQAIQGFMNANSRLIRIGRKDLIDLYVTNNEPDWLRT